jgi:hypothetical protein
VELTAAASRAVDDGLFVTSASQLTAPAEQPPSLGQEAKTTSIDATQAAAPSPVPGREAPNVTGPRKDELLDTDSTAEMFAEIAKDCQNRAFEQMRANLESVLKHAKDFAEKGAASEAIPKHGSGLLEVLKGVTEKFNAEALAMVKANAITTVEYARELAKTKTAAEFIELSSAQARKQCELILKQADALNAATQVITKSCGDESVE